MELTNRLSLFKEILKSKKLAGAVLFRPQRIQYFINFFHLSTERPIALIIPVHGEPAMMVPKLEEEHLALQSPWISQVFVYEEYPGTTHPMILLADFINKLGIASQHLGADHDGFLDQNSYAGPSLHSVMKTDIVDIGKDVDNLRMVKAADELDLMRQSGHWAAVAHKCLQAEMVEGESEHAISRRAEEKAFNLLKEQVDLTGHFGTVGLHASFRSGVKTSMGHAAMDSKLLERGDNLVTYCQGIASGYIAELERTLFFGEPSAEKKEYFQIVRDARQMVLDMLKPGVECSQIDISVREFFKTRGVLSYTTHHQGHGLGLEFHEAPFLDIGDPTVLQAGMVVSVEPGLYIKGLGGFRHSDTVAITETGYEILTPYPSELESLIIEPSS
jgi:Xaa-Pro aminopeptidase